MPHINCELSCLPYRIEICIIKNILYIVNTPLKWILATFGVEAFVVALILGNLSCRNVIHFKSVAEKKNERA